MILLYMKLQVDPARVSFPTVNSAHEYKQPWSMQRPDINAIFGDPWTKLSQEKASAAGEGDKERNQRERQKSGAEGGWCKEEVEANR